MRVTSCRSCSASRLVVFLDLGKQPIANQLIEEGDLAGEDQTFPLELAFCEECALVQVTETIPAQTLFGQDYPYYSSFSPALLAHSRTHVEALIRERQLGPDSLVIEVGSNDGYLLRNFIEHGIPVLGIDPAKGPAETARARGVPTRNEFFGMSLARSLADEGQQADVIIANNVAAHVDTINDFVGGLAAILKDDGIVRIEVAYLRDLIEKCEFDTVYHEHLFYHSLTALIPLFRRHGLFVSDVERLWIHGGSIRISATKQPGQSERLKAALEEERALGMDRLAFYEDFSKAVARVKKELRGLIADRRGEGDRFAAYGAAAKGATLLNYLGLEPGTIEYVVDKNTHKVGKYMPGVRLPIVSVGHLLSDRPAYVLMLAWNFAEEILRENAAYIAEGGKFILPIPAPRVVPSA